MTGSSEEYVEKALREAFASSRAEDPSSAPHAAVNGPDEEPPPSIPLPERVGRYPVEALVGRGGIGLVLRARDLELDRRVAVKVLHEHLAGEPEMARRFVEEARVGGSLEHPGVVPIHEMGRTDDGRPYFTMKLVEGETLAAALAGRKSPEEDRLRFLSAFGKICQIVAYAHAKGICHLDLKPANVLVGAFGEILVTDWGFASGLGPSKGAHIVGTPAYMSPEQARGDLERCGSRSDVFALGAILCEILTGVPPYSAESASEVLLAAARAWLDDASRRLECCGADPELVALARRCLSPEPGDRPRDAGEVAGEIDRYPRSLDERARDLAIEAARAKARAAAERRQRRLVVGCAAGVILAVLIACAAWFSFERDRARRTLQDERLAVEMAERVRILAEDARGAGDPALWEEPALLARQAADLARARGLSESLREQLEELLAQTESAREEAVRDDRVLRELLSIEERAGDVREAGLKDRDYAEVFRRGGVDLETLAADEAAARIRANSIRTHLVGAIDDWAHARDSSRGAATASSLVEIANRVDPDPWRVRVRTAAMDRDMKTLEALAASPERQAKPPETQMLLATSLRRAGRPERAAEILESAQRRFPDHYGLHHHLGMLLREGPSQDLAESVRQFSMALALRPRNAHAAVDLAQVFLQSGDLEKAETHLEEALGTDPEYAPAIHYLGLIALKRRDLPRAEELLRRSRAIDPESTLSLPGLGAVLQRMGRLEEAAEALRALVDLDPGSSRGWCELGRLLVELGRFREGKECLEKGHAIAEARGEEWAEPCSSWIADARRLLEAEDALRDLGSALPSDWGPEDLLVLARAAWLLDRPVTAAKITEVLLEQWRSAEEAPADVLLLGGRAAASAAAGAGSEPVEPKDAAPWRERALRWLDASLDDLEETPVSEEDREGAGAALESFLTDARLAGLRESKALAALPEEASEGWAALWERVRRLIDRFEER
jgi:serine/threonine-protein kinase